MGDRIQQVATTIFALAFAALLAVLSSNFLFTGVTINEQMSRTYANNEMYELNKLSEASVSGATVISAIKNYDVIYDYKIEILVETNSGRAAYGAEITSDGGYQRNPTNYTDTSSMYYINPQAKFEGEIIRNNNDIITSIKFTEKA